MKLNILAVFSGSAYLGAHSKWLYAILTNPELPSSYAGYAGVELAVIALLVWCVAAAVWRQILQDDKPNKAGHNVPKLRWIAKDERLPTEADADEFAKVEAWGHRGHVFQVAWHCVKIHSDVTHWAPRNHVRKPEGI